MQPPRRKERRRLSRLTSRIPARFQTLGLNGEGYVKNVCREGVFLRTAPLPDPGSPIHITLELENGRKVEASGVVAWTTDQLGPDHPAAPGFGVRFPSPNDDFLEFFEYILLH